MTSIGTRGVRRRQRKDVARHATIRHSESRRCVQRSRLLRPERPPHPILLESGDVRPSATVQTRLSIRYHGALTKRRTDDVNTDRTRSRAPQGGQKADQKAYMHKTRSAARTTEFATQIPAGQADDCDKRQQSRTAKTTEFATQIPAGQADDCDKRQQSRTQASPTPRTLQNSSHQQGSHHHVNQGSAQERLPDRSNKKHRKIQRQLTPMDKEKSDSNRGRYKHLGSRREQNRPTPAPISRDRRQASN